MDDSGKADLPVGAASEPTATASVIDELYVREYLYSTGAWDDFDTRCLTIKGWTAVGGLAAVLAGLSSKDLSVPILGGAILVILSLWVLDAQWRVFQHSNHRRIVQLEEYFGGRRHLDAPLQCHTSSAQVRAEEGWRAWPRELLSPLVFVPYLPLVVLLGAVGIARALAALSLMI